MVKSLYFFQSLTHMWRVGWEITLMLIFVPKNTNESMNIVLAFWFVSLTNKWWCLGNLALSKVMLPSIW